MLLRGRGVWLRGWSRRGSVGVGVGGDVRVFGGWEGFEEEEEGCLAVDGLLLHAGLVRSGCRPS